MRQKSGPTLMRRLRRDRDLSLDAVGVATGIQQATLSRLERRLVAATPDQKKALAKFFRMDADALFGDASATLQGSV